MPPVSKIRGGTLPQKKGAVLAPSFILHLALGYLPVLSALLLLSGTHLPAVPATPEFQVSSRGEPASFPPVRPVSDWSPRPEPRLDCSATVHRTQPCQPPPADQALNAEPSAEIPPQPEQKCGNKQDSRCPKQSGRPLTKILDQSISHETPPRRKGGKSPPNPHRLNQICKWSTMLNAV